METRNISLKQFIQNLDAPTLRTWAGKTIYERGQDYCGQELIKAIELNGAEITATCEGMQDEYSLSVAEEQGVINMSCDCPYDSYPCKHIIALLLTLKDDKEYYISRLEGKKETLPALKKMSNHGDTIEDLETEIQIIFEKKYTNVNAINQFEQQLEAVWLRLKAMWQEDIEKSTEFFIYVASEIEESALNYRLQDVNDYNQTYTYEDLEKHLKPFLKMLPIKQRVYAYEKLLIATKLYSFVDCNFLQDIANICNGSEKYALKDFWLESLKGECKFDFQVMNTIKKYVQSALTDTEEQLFLSKYYTKEEAIAFKYAQTHLQKEDAIKAIQIIDAWYDKNHPINSSAHRVDHTRVDFALALLKLAEKDKINQHTVVNWVVKSAPYQYIITKATGIMPDQQKHFELVLREKNTEHYKSYLEAGKRIEELLAFLESQKDPKQEYILFEFWKRHKESLPEKAIQYFGKELAKVINETGNDYYDRSVLILTQLEKLLPKATFTEYMNVIVSENKKKRVFIEKLQVAFKAYIR